MVNGERGMVSRDRPQFLTDDHLLLDAGTPVGDVELPFFGSAGERRGLLEGGLAWS